MNKIDVFCNIIRKRSSDHAQAMERLQDLPSMMIAILRQELDSLIRVVYLLDLSDFEERERFISQTLDGDKWTIKTHKGKDKTLTDAEMVETCNEIFGWTEKVYKAGCSLIHLSNLHGVTVDDEIHDFWTLEISQDEVLDYLKQFHDLPDLDSPTLNDISPYFPKVLKKISDNLERYLEQLSEQKI